MSRQPQPRSLLETTNSSDHQQQHSPHLFGALAYFVFGCPVKWPCFVLMNWTSPGVLFWKRLVLARNFPWQEWSSLHGCLTTVVTVVKILRRRSKPWLKPVRNLPGCLPWDSSRVAKNVAGFSAWTPRPHFYCYHTYVYIIDLWGGHDRLALFWIVL